MWRAATNAALWARHRHGANRIRIVGYETIVTRPEHSLRHLAGWPGIGFGRGCSARAFIRDKTCFRALARVLAALVIYTLPFAIYETLTGRPPIIEALDRLPAIPAFAL